MVMGKTVLMGFLKWAPWAVAAGALCFTVWALLAQVATQHDLNEAMLGVRANVSTAKDLTAETARVLSPLASTADTIAAMNKGMESMIGDLQAMNGSMARIATKQQSILNTVDSLNSHTSTVIADLGAVDGKNRLLLGATEAMTELTADQAGSVAELSDLTGAAIDHMHNLNRKFGFLAQF
jgi:hypothetical protein